jgi:hypothetical protein
MKAADRMPLDFADLLHGLRVIETESGSAKGDAIDLMIREVGTLPPCTARDRFLVELERARLFSATSGLVEPFLEMTCVFAGWGCAAWLDAQQHAEQVRQGQSGGRPADDEIHLCRARKVEQIRLRNPALSIAQACKRIADQEGVSSSAIRKSVQKVGK